MELVVLLVAAVALVAVYYALTAVTTWWDGFRNSNKAVLRAVPVIAIVIAFVVFVSPESAALDPVVDVAVGAAVVLFLIAGAVLAVAAWRRPRRRQAGASPTVPQSKRPLVERIPSGRNRQHHASRPPPLVERNQRKRTTEHSAPRSRRPPAQRSGSRWKSVYNAAGREQFVYAMGAFDNLTGDCRTIKLGVSTALERRIDQIHREQVARTHTAKLLGSGPGGEQREKLLLARLDEWRYPASEWFEASPEVLAEVAKLERLTDDGRRLTEEAKRSA